MQQGASDTALRREIIEACLDMEAKGINQGTSGNISCRSEDGMLITPTAMAYDALQPGDIVRMNFDGETEGPRKPSSEWRFHLDILRERPDVGAVVHAHPMACTTLAIMGKGIPAIHYMIAAAGGPDIRCSGYATYGSAALSELAIGALEGRNACLLGHHGMIAVGPSLERAMWLALEVEVLARQYLECLKLGEPPVLPDDEIERVVQKFRGYGQGAEEPNTPE